jgi:hypothetical protein
MKSSMMLAVSAGALMGLQAVAAAPAKAGARCGHPVAHRVACCLPRFAYYKTLQYWPVTRRAVNGAGYFHLVAYRAVKVRRNR